MPRAATVTLTVGLLLLLPLGAGCKTEGSGGSSGGGGAAPASKPVLRQLERPLTASAGSVVETCRLHLIRCDHRPRNLADYPSCVQLAEEIPNACPKQACKMALTLMEKRLCTADPNAACAGLAGKPEQLTRFYAWNKACR